MSGMIIAHRIVNLLRTGVSAWVRTPSEGRYGHRILPMVVGRKVGTSGADVSEKHDLEIVFEFGRHETPHVLIAAKAMGKNHRPVAVSTTCTLFLAKTLN